MDHKVLSCAKGDKQDKTHAVCLHLYEIQNLAKEKLIIYRFIYLWIKL